MKLIIIIVVVLMLLGGGGAATWFFVIEDPNAAQDEPPPPADPIFLALEKLRVHVIRGGGVQKYVVIDITLELRDADARSLAEKKMPKLRDVYINALNEYFTNLPSLKGAVKIQHVKKRLLRHSEKALGKGAVTDVLVQSIAESDGKALN